jgi:hypothetical protein
MLRAALSRLAARLGRGDADAEDGTDRSRFVPSPLDASVRYAHGAPDDEVDRELARVDDAARRLEDAREE